MGTPILCESCPDVVYCLSFDDLDDRALHNGLDICAFGLGFSQSLIHLVFQMTFDPLLQLETGMVVSRQWVV